MTNRKWETPKLIVLARGRPEEGVLTNCRNASTIPTSLINTSKRGCKDRITGTCTGADCSGTTGS